MEGASADFGVTARVCETLHGLAQDPKEAECLLDMLVTAGHCPRFGCQQRATLYRLADLLAISWDKSWEYGTEAGKCIDACIRVKCYVPERDGSIWDTVAGSAAINAAMFGSAATSLRFLQAQLPQDVSFLRTQSWCHMGQECLSTCAQLMRYATPSSRSAGPVSTVATELREEMSR